MCSSFFPDYFLEATTLEPVLCLGYEAMGLAVGGNISKGGKAIASTPAACKAGGCLAWCAPQGCSLSSSYCVWCNSVSTKQSRIKGLLTTNEIRRGQQFVILPSKLTPMMLGQETFVVSYRAKPGLDGGGVLVSNPWLLLLEHNPLACCSLKFCL